MSQQSRLSLRDGGAGRFSSVTGRGGECRRDDGEKSFHDLPPCSCDNWSAWERVDSSALSAFAAIRISVGLESLPALSYPLRRNHGRALMNLSDLFADEDYRFQMGLRRG